MVKNALIGERKDDGMAGGTKPRRSKRPAKGSGVEFAYQVLRQEIVSLRLAPGSSLDEVELAQRLGLSRTPVHEALVRLSHDSLVEFLPNRGSRVAGMDWNEIREFLEAFDIHQRLATRWAALRRTEDDLRAMERERAAFESAALSGDVGEMDESNLRFHGIIAAAAKNRIIERSYLHLLTLGLRISHIAMNVAFYSSAEQHKSHVDNILAEHVDIIEAIRARDADRAEALAKSHTDLARKRITETMTQSLTPEMELRLA